MAEMARMTAAQLADKLLSAEHADLVRERVAWMAAERMDAEVAAQIVAEHSGSRTATATAPGSGTPAWAASSCTFPGCAPAATSRRSWNPAAVRSRRWSRSWEEAYVNGVSTRRVDRLVEQMGVAGLSKDQVSRLCRGLLVDEQVRSFRERPLEGRYPYLWLDAKVERVHEPGGVRHKALVIACGVHETGRREAIGIDVGEAETEAFWREFLRRGLCGVRLCISDAHAA